MTRVTQPQPQPSAEMLKEIDKSHGINPQPPTADPQQALTQLAAGLVTALGTLTVILRNLPAILALLQRIASEVGMDQERQG